MEINDKKMFTEDHLSVDQLLVCMACLIILCPCVSSVPHCHSPQSICGHSALVNRFIPLLLSLRFMMCCVTEGNYYDLRFDF